MRLYATEESGFVGQQNQGLMLGELSQSREGILLIIAFVGVKNERAELVQSFEPINS